MRTAVGRPIRHRCTRVLPCVPESAKQARDLVARELNGWGLDALVDDAGVMVSELVANAARHTGCRTLSVAVERLHPERLRVSVTDGSRTLPVVIDAGPGATCGRGMALVAGLADRWGVIPMPLGKVVWFELGASTPSAA